MPCEFKGIVILLIEMMTLVCTAWQSGHMHDDTKVVRESDQLGNPATSDTRSRHLAHAYNWGSKFGVIKPNPNLAKLMLCNKIHSLIQRPRRSYSDHFRQPSIDSFRTQ